MRLLWKLVTLLPLIHTCAGAAAWSRPTFTQEPEDAVFPLDASESEIILSCAAHGSPPPRYRWKQNGTDIDFSTSQHHRLAAGGLAIGSPYTAEDAGFYQCLATNALGTVLSRRAKLQFAHIDDFETKARSTVSVREGQGVVLLCGPPPHFGDLSYAWTFNASPLHVQEDSRRFVSQETGNLYFAKVQPSDVGNYTCWVTSREARRSVRAPPTPLVLRSDGVMGEYEPKIEVRFPETIQAAKDSTVNWNALPLEIPDISWRRLSGGPLPGKAQRRRPHAVLEIPSFQPEDEGVYECAAGNLRGSNLAKGQLVSYAPPEWEQKIHNTYLSIHDSLFWECKASGKPRPWYTWLKNGERLSPEERIQIENGTLTITSLNMSDSGIYQCAAENSHQIIYANAELRVLEWSLGADGSLRMRNVTRADAGGYTCVATNQFGVARSTGSLVVKERTVLSAPPPSMDVTVGESIVLPCQASHDPSVDVAFRWSFNGAAIDLRRGASHFERIGGASVGDLMIRNIQLSHSGKYVCTASSPLDSLSAAADVIVRGPPGPPEGVRVEHVSSTRAQLSWRPGPDNSSPVQIFAVQARTAFSVGWQAVSTVPEILSGEMYNATVVGLSPWVEYEFRVVAGNSIGIGEPSRPSELLRTKAAAPAVAPTNVNGGGGGRSELVVTWESIPEELQSGEGFGYVVLFRPVGAAAWTAERAPTVEASRLVYCNESIAPLSPFEVKVGVYNLEGEGPLSPASIIYSGEDEPQLAPRGASAQSSSASEVEVSWHAIAWNRNTGRVLGYEVLYWTDDPGEAMIGRTRVGGNVTTTHITGLRPNTVYFASVRAFNTAGTGPSSPPVNATTKKSPPSQPPANIAWKLANSKLCLNWEHVKTMENESEVLGYKILYRQNRQGKAHVLETNNTSAELLAPLEEDYLVAIRTVSDGGDGSSSEEIRIPRVSRFEL